MIKSTIVTPNLIRGKWVKKDLSAAVSSISPINQSVVGMVPRCTAADVDEVMEVAKQAQPSWYKMPRTHRAGILHKAARLLREKELALSDLLTREIAKSHAEASDEVRRSADMIDAFANAALSLEGESYVGDGYPGYDQSRRAVVDLVPHGIVLAMPPFNYPINLAVAKIAPALMMGNAVVVKPPTHGALSCLQLITCFHDAGVPAGIIQSITGEGKMIGTPLVTHPDVGMIAFTGSSSVGILLSKQVGMIPLLLECGGNNAALVLEDADMNQTAKEIVKGGFSYSGQRCTAINYVLAQEKTIDTLVPLVVKQIHSSLVIGDPRKKEVTYGPLINESEAMHIESRIQEAIKEGATCVIGGTREGCMIHPTILTNVQAGADIMKEEVFGPVVSFVSVSSVDDMVSIVEASDYGLQTSVFTNNMGVATSLAQSLTVGSVLINSRPQRGPDHFPFTGVKASGIGTQSITRTLLAMSRPKTLVYSI